RPGARGIRAPLSAVARDRRALPGRLPARLLDPGRALDEPGNRDFDLPRRRRGLRLAEVGGAGSRQALATSTRRDRIVRTRLTKCYIDPHVRPLHPDARRL